MHRSSVCPWCTLDSLSFMPVDAKLASHSWFGVQIGTPQYMAPEMHAGHAYSFAADVWSLGCLLYELCALQPLFQDREEQVVARKVGSWCG